MNLASELSADERNGLHSAYINQLVSGTMSGREFVEQLQCVCGFTLQEASVQWSDCKKELPLAIYTKRQGEIVQASMADGGKPSRSRLSMSAMRAPWFACARNRRRRYRSHCMN